MPGLVWTEDEIVTVLFFASRRLPLDLIERIMRLRKFPSTRSEVGIRDKLKDLKKRHRDLIEKNDEWDLYKVDSWIESRHLQNPIQNLLMYGSREKDLTWEVSVCPSVGCP